MEVTTALASGLLDASIERVADLSCGDATIAKTLAKRGVAVDLVLGDIAPEYEHAGPIEKTIDEIDPVDIFVCSETIEHLDDPDLVLRKIRTKTRHLVLTTPIRAFGETNPEHYWAWDRDDVEGMLLDAGFRTLKPYVELDMRESWSPYCFGMWVAS